MSDDHQAYSWTKEHLIEVLTSGKRPLLTNTKLVKAFKEIDRQDFMNKDKILDTYPDEHDELDFGEVVESPVLQAQFLNALDLNTGMKVLEIGTGSGLATALIAYVISPDGFVFSIERNQRLADLARHNLKKYADLKNYEVIFNDGADGLISRAPFNAIYTTIAFSEIPETIVAQLAVGGKMILPFVNGDIKLISRLTDEDFEEELLTVKDLKRLKFGVE